MWLSPQHFDGKWAIIKQDWPRALRMRMTTLALHATSTPIAHEEGLRRTAQGRGQPRLVCMCVCKSRAWLALCGLLCAGALAIVIGLCSEHVQPNRARVAGAWASGLTAAALPILIHLAAPRHFSPRGRCAQMHMPLP